MPNYTENYNLKKPLPNENYNVEDFNDNADIIDQKIKEIENSVENIEVPVTSVNNKTGDIELTAADVGAETPEGAQQKADTAEANAKDYADSIKPTKLSQLTNDTGYITSQRAVSDSVSSTSSTVAASSKAVKTAYDKAVSALDTANSKLNSSAYTASDVLTKLKTVDGSGSGLDADKLDGWHRDDIRNWNNILNKPSTFTPSTHTHSSSDIIDGVKIATGTYTGDGTDDRAINVGFEPKLVYIWVGHGDKRSFRVTSIACRRLVARDANGTVWLEESTSVNINSTGFSVDRYANYDTISYYWEAWG